MRANEQRPDFVHEFFAGFVIAEESVLVGEVELAVIWKFWFFGKSFCSGSVKTEKIVEPSFDSNFNILYSRFSSFNI